MDFIDRVLVASLEVLEADDEDDKELATPEPGFLEAADWPCCFPAEPEPFASYSSSFVWLHGGVSSSSAAMVLSVGLWRGILRAAAAMQAGWPDRRRSY